MKRTIDMLKAGLAALMLAGLCLAPAQAADDEAAIAEIRSAWAACTAVLDEHPDDWIGWRRDFMNGYYDAFRFYDNRFGGDLPTVLVRDIGTDGIYFETITSCYREDGTLAFLFTQASSPNYADGGDMGPPIQRQGRLYFDAEGKLVRLLATITDEDGRELSQDTGNDQYMLARGCSPVTVHRMADSIETEYFSVLGDIEGKYPESTGEDYDWCAAADADG